MPLFDFHCSFCGKEFEDMVDDPNSGAVCTCGNQAQLIWKSFPGVNFKYWMPDYTKMDGRKEAIAAGMEE